MSHFCQGRLVGEIAPQPTVLGLSPFGIGVNGVPFDPGAAEWWNGDPGSGWQYEALSGAIDAGLDDSNAHVQPTGAYHYHGILEGLVDNLGVLVHRFSLNLPTVRLQSEWDISG